MRHIILGLKGEFLARKYLKKNRYKIIKANYKNRIGEIDIIAEYKKQIVFVEVKTRTSTKYGRASEAVNSHKQHKIRNVATSFLMKKHWMERQVRFDVIEVYGKEINHIQNAF